MNTIKVSVALIATLFATAFSAQAQNVDARVDSVEVKTQVANVQTPQAASVQTPQVNMQTPLTIEQTDVKDDGFTPRCELSVSYGLANETDVMQAASNTFGMMATSIFGNGKLEHPTYLGTFNVDFGYHITPRLVVGLNASYSHISAYSQSCKTYEKDAKWKVDGGDHKYDFFTVMPSIKYAWINKPHFTLYSRLGAGVILAHEVERMPTDQQHNCNDKSVRNSAIFAFQISPVGVEWGGQKVRGFAEAGFGQCGAIQAGVRFRF